MQIYNLDTNVWTKVTLEGTPNSIKGDYINCVYNDNLYLIMGWGDGTIDESKMIYKISLSNDDFKLQMIHISNEGMADWVYGYTCKDNLAYIFGGGSNINGYFNNLSILDLSLESLEFQTLSANTNVPTARRAHAMEAYNDKLYIFGGVDSNKKR